MLPNPQEAADLVTFAEEILNGKLHFSCSDVLCVTTYVLSAKKPLPVCPETVTRSKREEQKNDKNGNYKAFCVTHKREKLKCRNRCRAGTLSNMGGNWEISKKLQNEEDGIFWPDTGGAVGDLGF